MVKKMIELSDKFHKYDYVRITKTKSKVILNVVIDGAGNTFKIDKEKLIKFIEGGK